MARTAKMQMIAAAASSSINEKARALRRVSGNFGRLRLQKMAFDVFMICGCQFKNWDNFNRLEAVLK
jgi:hypothetical protein